MALHSAASAYPSAYPRNMLTMQTPEIVITPGASRRKYVHHWARVWLGTPKPDQPNMYDWIDDDPNELEVSIQEYGEPNWIEKLFADMIDAGRETLGSVDRRYTAVRLRVRLYSHRADGTNAKFTLEHVARRMTSAVADSADDET